jgi:TatD DNase family protein
VHIDFHTHRALYNDEYHIEVLSAHIQPKSYDNYYTIGHHPWWTEKELEIDELKSLEAHLSHPRCLGIGECGLDKLKGASKEIQEKVFYQQATLAQNYKVPLIMHCVRQYDRAIQIRKDFTTNPWCIHGFRRNHILAGQLLDAGIMVSISPILHMTDSFTEMIKYLPLDQFFIETDSEYSMSIKERYEAVAQIKKIDIFALRQQMVDNFNNFFKWKQLNLIGSSEPNF